MEPLRHVENPGFRAVIFRRTLTQVKQSGGLWDTSKTLYARLRDRNGRGVATTEQPPLIRFPSGATIQFSHLEYEKDIEPWDGSQIAFLGFDELIHFTPSQFWYLVSRNRSACGVRPYIRATTNPQTSGWVKRLISWWLYPDDHEDFTKRGMPIPERAGVVRYLARYQEKMYWGDTPEAAIAALPSDGRDEFSPELVKSVTFIPGLLHENTALTSADPAYKGNLLAQDKRNATRLLRGCWYDTEGADELFDYSKLRDMFTNSFVQRGEKYMTADIAMDGSDLFRVGIWSGLRLEHRYEWEKSDGKQIWKEMERLAEKHSVPGRNIVFDANGVGNYLKGFFKNSCDFRSQSSPALDEKLKVDYQNLRTQCAYKLAELVGESLVYAAVEDENERDYICAEFEAHRKKGATETGKLTITKKDDVKAVIKRSPDYFDLFLMRMVFEIDKRKRSYLSQENT